MMNRTAPTGPPSVYILYQDYNLCLCFASKCVTIKQVRGISAAGSAFDWQSRGQGFDPPMLHHINPVITMVTGFVFFTRLHLGYIFAFSIGSKRRLSIVPLDPYPAVTFHGHLIQVLLQDANQFLNNDWLG